MRVNRRTSARGWPDVRAWGPDVRVGGDGGGVRLDVQKWAIVPA